MATTILFGFICAANQCVPLRGIREVADAVHSHSSAERRFIQCELVVLPETAARDAASHS